MARVTWNCLYRGCLTFLFLVFATHALRADDVDRAADISVEAFSAGGALVGVTLGSTEKALMKSLVACSVRGSPIPNCARDELVKVLPRDAQPFAKCLLQGKSVAACGRDTLIAKLPPQAQGLAQCIATDADIVGCGRKFAVDEAQRAAFNTINAIKADGRDELGQPGSGTIRNMLGVAQGIREDNWGKVVQHGGPEIAKATGKILLRVFLGPAAAPLDPAVDALIQNRVDLANDFFKAVKSKNEAKIAEVVIQAYVYLSLPLAQGCALIPDGKVKEVTCGTIGKALTAISKAGGGIAEWGVDTAKDFASIFGIDTGEFVSQCGRSDAYYAKNMSVCWPHLAQSQSVNPKKFEDLVGTLDNLCRNHYLPCHDNRLFGRDSDRVSEICNPLKERLRRDVGKLQDAMAQTAMLFARSYPAMTFADTEPGEYCEARGAQKFLPDCIDALSAQFAVQGAGPRNACRPAGRDQGEASPLWGICADAAFVKDRAGKLRFNLKATCTPPCPEGMRGSPPNCSCYDGQVRRGNQCVDPTCPPGQVGTPPNCRIIPPTPVVCQGGMVGIPPRCTCPQNTRWTGSTCAPLTCGNGMIGVYPNCRCPEGTAPRGASCVQIACPAGMVGTQPNCRCPQGTVQRGGTCAPVACPNGKVGSFPNCHCPAGMMSRGEECVRLTCSNGKIGNYPNCQCPSFTVPRGEGCAPMACQNGMIGTVPNCRCPAGMTQRGNGCVPLVCSNGKVGMYPNCRCPAGTTPRGDGCATIGCPPGKFGTFPNCQCPAGTMPRGNGCVKVGCPAGTQGTPPNCKPVAPQCPMVRVCVKWGRPAPNTFAGPCLRYEMRRECAPVVR